MSNVKIQGNSSGTGTLTIAAPNTNSDFTLNLPAFSGTIPTLASVTNNGVAYVNASGQTTSGSALTFDGSNLGLGVTPSAWATVPAFSFGTSAKGSLSYVGGATSLGDNFYRPSAGVFNYTTTAAAGLYQIAGASHIWYTAPSGTAGNAISFTQAMTLDASGNLGVGTTSPTEKIHSSGGIVAKGSASLTSGAGAYIYYTSGTSSAEISALNPGVAWLNQKYGALTHAWSISGSEVARIDSSGRLLVGTPSLLNNAPTTVQVLAQSTSSSAIVAVGQNGNSASIITSQSVSTGSTGWYAYIGQSGNGSSITTNTFFVYGNGNVQNANNSYGAISDIKLKENIVDATPKLENLCKVRVVNYNLIGDYEQHKQIGVIAQEVEQIFPGIVEESPDRDAEGNDLGTTTKSVKYSVFVPMLIKAIQEQQTQISDQQAIIDAQQAALDSLKARFDAANL